ncbi:DUF1080 domain-containing protein, partial [bacterium]|nr:DUF1080 domain-containing protein [bacterium]
MKRFSSFISIFIFTAVFIIAVQVFASETVSASKTINLFNGKDFDDWHMFVEDDSVDVQTVWKIKDGAIWCKGDPIGFIRTKAEFTNFKLTVEWMWPEEPTNSGVLIRMSDEDTKFPLCMEAQLKYQSAGDAVGMGCDFNENESKEGSFFRVAKKKQESNETEPGKWNSYEITCKGDVMEIRVNGLLQNKVTGICVTKGHIG